MRLATTDGRNEAPVLSVIVPVRNYGRYLGATLDSILTQSFRDFELVIVDDGSDDGTPDVIAERVGDPRVRAVRNHSALGQFQTHNRGAELARGKYLKFFHGDDIMHPHCLRLMVGLMEAFPEAALGISHPSAPWIAPHLFAPGEALQAELAGQTSLLCEGPSATIFRADVFRECGAFRTRYVPDDMEMNYRVAGRHPVLLLPAGLWWWRLHPHQVSSASLGHRGRIQRSVEEFVAIREVLESRELSLPEGQRAKAVRRHRRNYARLVLHSMRKGHPAAARSLLVGARLPWTFLLCALGNRPRPDPVPVDAVPHWQDFPRVTEAAPGATGVPPRGQTPCVSLVVANDGRKGALRATIESLSSQEFGDFEVLVTGPAEPSLPADDRVRFMAGGPLAGSPWDAFNAAMRRCEGEFVMFLRAGSLLYPHALQLLVQSARDFPSAAFVQSHDTRRFLPPRLISPREIYRQEFFGDVRLWESPERTLYRRSVLPEGPACFAVSAGSPHAALNLRLAEVGSAVITYGGLAYVPDELAPAPHHPALGYAAADLPWLDRLLEGPECPLEAPEREKAKEVAAAIRARVVAGSNGRSQIPHRPAADVWHRYGQVAGLQATGSASA